MGKSFQPPRWCRPPKRPGKRRQELRFLNEDVSSSSPVSRRLLISDKAVYTIGRSEAADIQLRGDLVSRLHAAVLQDVEGNKFLVDLKSTHGTFLSSKRLSPHQPVRWSTGAEVQFGSGSLAEAVVLGPELSNAEGDWTRPAKRKRENVDTDDEDQLVRHPMSLYDGLPEAARVEYVPKAETAQEPLLEIEEDVTKVVFLDVDGVLRPVHGRTNFLKTARTMMVDGERVPLLGDTEAKAGLDFWPSAMRALRHVSRKTNARIVLSSDWRKEHVLKQGVNQALQEHGMLGLYDETPDLDHTAPGVIKAIHSSFREKRCKEIRKWLRTHPKVTQFVAIDDIDLSQVEKNETGMCLDPNLEFIRTNPSQGLTLELAKLAVSFLNGVEATGEDFAAAYGTAQAADRCV